MNRYAFLLFLAAALAGLGAPGVNAQSHLDRCDKPMADAESMVRQVGACVESLAASSSAPASASAVANGGATKEIVEAATTESMTRDFIAYAAFSAYAASDLNSCAPQPFGHWESSCRDAVLEMRAARAAVSGPSKFIGACRLTDQPKNAAEAKQRARCCEILAQSIGRPQNCVGILRDCEPDPKACQAYLSSLAGDASGCGQIVPGNEETCTGVEDCRRVREDCRATALFVAAYKAKDIKLCGTSDQCRVMMGAGKTVVRELAAKLSRTPAGRWYVGRDWDESKRSAPAPKFVSTIRGFTCEPPVGSDANRLATTAVLSAARSCYADIEIALANVDLAVSRAIDENEEKLIRLGLRLDALLDGAAKTRGAPAKQGR